MGAHKLEKDDDCTIEETEDTPTNANNNTDTKVVPSDVELTAVRKFTDPAKDEPKEAAETKKDEATPMVGTFELLRFATRGDICLIVVGFLAAVANGIGMPAMIILFGKMINEFVSVNDLMSVYNARNTSANATNPDMKSMGEIGVILLKNMREYTLYFVGLGVAIWIVSYIQMVCFGISAERQCRTIRLRLFHTILRQHIGWFDTHDIGELNTRLSDDVNKIKEGLGEKVGAFFQNLSMALTGFIIGFYYGWKLTLVIMSVSPLMAFGAFFMMKLLADLTSGELKAYAEAGSVAEEVLGAIRTVAAFGGQHKETERYSSRLDAARAYGVRKGLINGAGMGFVMFVMLGTYALAFWYGGVLLREKDSDYNAGSIIIVFISVIFGAFALGTAAPYLQNISVGRGAAYSVYSIIDQVSQIDSFSQDGQKPSNFSGNLILQDVHFSYPSRSDIKVLNGLSLQINVGERVALVGASGCGKSTVIQLVQRFYDPDKGLVTLGGVDVRKLNVGWLRQHLGVVSQEPILFGMTIKENLRYGRLDVTQDEMEEATRQANAYGFIMELPDKFDTLVGERGAQLSGGQKQRIAIARALIRNPTILLLDEATSALDNESEAIVQEALDKASAGRTTIIIAHRLSTIRNADRIIAIQDGRVVEQGSHDELMSKGDGVYARLVKAQTLDEGEDDDDFEDLDLQTDAEKRRFHRLMSVASVSSDVVGPFNTEEEKLAEPKMSRIFILNRPEWAFIFLGTVAAIVNGGVQPVFGYVLSQAMFVFTNENELNKYCIGFLGMAIAVMISFFLQSYMYGISGERLTMRIRQLAFKAMVHQDMEWFDDDKNNTGALCTRLATEASQVQGATGIRVGTLMQQVGSMLLAIGISFGHEWAMTLVIMAFVPFIMISGYLQMVVMAGSSLSNKHALEDAGKVAVESVENIRTVAALTREALFYEKYVEKFTDPYRAALKKAHVVGIAFGFSQGILFFIYAAAFYFGAWRVDHSGVDPKKVFVVFMSLVFGAIAAGQASSFAPDYGKAKAAATTFFALLDRKPVIDSSSPDGLQPEKGMYTSSVKFDEVKFEYPTRADVKVLRGLSMGVNPGETVALVGSSGCGKSTVIQLLERFYNPREGQVYLDSYNTAELNVQWLRSQIGIVSQEPILFDRTICENIQYGDNSRVVAMDEVIAAARKANIHAFIDSLPLKYDTNVGSKGTQLSGGQKQRVAIARALVRDPKILLLDEATSALDTESEKVVQEALDNAREGRTSIVIAHRLSTIQNVDKIFVIRRGRVTESGSHSELMANRKFYYRLVTQSV